MPKAAMPQPAILLFDLGGVLVDNAMFEDMPRLLPAPIPEDDLCARWIDSPAVHRFERGEISADEFASTFVSEWRLRMAPAAFLERFATWSRGFYPGAEALLTRLRRQYRVAYLSNCNEVHWSGFEHILRHADDAFSSHLCGLTKPDPAIFTMAVEALGRDPAEICFFDDSPRNVAAARAIGMDAHLTVGFEQLEETLRSMGLCEEAGLTTPH